MWALILDQRHQSPHGARRLDLGGTRQRILGFVLSGGHAGVDDPYGIRDDDGGTTGDGAGNHALDGGKLLGGAAGLDGGRLEKGTGPFVPVVVDKVGDGNAEQG